MKTSGHLTLLLLLLGCDGGKLVIDGDLDDHRPSSDADDTGGDSTPDTADPKARDADLDGFSADIDCDDLDPDIYPGAEEICDEIDQDCDGDIDEEAVDAPTWYSDLDGDGFGAAEIVSCTQPSGTTESGGDCDDDDATVHPEATEQCWDGVDNDCDGSAGDCGLAGIISIADATVVIHGTAAEDGLGRYAHNGGDVNGDGLDDLLIGLPDSDEATTDAGMVAVMAGGMSGEVTIDSATVVLYGGDAGDFAGRAVAGAGYVNDDILADMLIGAPGAYGVAIDAGAVYLVLGGSTGESWLGDAHETYLGEAAYDSAGFAVVRIGDTDGDGTSEFGIGAPNASEPTSNAGAVYFVSPQSGGTFNLSSADAHMVGTSPDEQAGRTLEPAGDLNGDGTADLLVGAPYHHGGGTSTESGRVYILFGLPEDGPLTEAGLIINGEGDYAYVGNDMAAVGDINEDGHPDIALASSNGDIAGHDTGEIYILFGPFDSDRSVLEADITVTGESDSDYAGGAIGAAGDYDGDGRPDLLIGAIGNDYGGANAGAGYLLLSPFDDFTSLASGEIKLHGTADNQHTGAHLGSAGDMDGDGRVDFFVGAPYTDHSAINAGSLHVFSGTAGM